MSKDHVIVNLADFHVAAKSKLDKEDYDYYASGAEDEITITRSEEAWRKMTIWPRFFVDVSNVKLDMKFLGIDSTMPVIVPPMAMQKLAHKEGEVGLARAAAAAGIIYCITEQATTKLETICQDAPGPKMFQMYIFKDRELSEKLIRRAEACGVKAIVVTVDRPVLGRREKDIRNKFTPASRGVEIVNWAADAKKDSGSTASSASAAPAASAVKAVAARTAGGDNGFVWEDLAWLRGLTKLPLILKGVLHPGDADLAIKHGCAAVWVSNHGGRQLDCGPSTAQALQLCAQAVNGRVPLIVDGGLRRGSDVLKALSLGATCACVGRPLLWGLATDGEKGAKMAIDIVRDELQATMALSGVPSVHNVSRGLIQAEGDAPPSAAKL